MRKILFVASECVPFIKTGGLADVVGTLPKSFDKGKFDVRVVLPNYLCIPEKYRKEMIDVTYFSMDVSWRQQYVGIKQLELDGITFYFIDNEYYFGGSVPYGEMYYDIEKFAFFGKAALAILPVIGFSPDIVHCHDWQAALVPAYLHAVFNTNPFYRNMKTIMTIHNLRFQGVCEIPKMIDVSGLPEDIFTSDKMEAYGDANMLKGGLVYADRITTVSETYAREIQMPFYGENLDGLLRARNNVLSGIVNGIDYTEYDPSTDKKIFTTYNKKNFEKKKIENKCALQKELGLPVDSNKFMIGVVSRLTDQKGFDLIDCVMDAICDDNTQFVVLGTGEQRYEDMLRFYEWIKKDRVSASIYYSDERAHKIYAACDAFLMPSAFEPCGLSQLMALRYGTVPIVRETGGLCDTVEAYNEYEGTGTGFRFTNYNAHEMLGCINYAKEVFFTKRNEWNQIVKRAMEVDFSWQKSAHSYERLYGELIIEKDRENGKES